jgi:hypothetical protein
MFWTENKSYSFTYFSIFLHAPAKPGIYAIHSENRLIYVGESENIRESLQRHLQGENPWVSVWEPSGFCYEVCLDQSRITRKEQLVAQLRPVVTDHVNALWPDSTSETSERRSGFHRSYFDPHN